MSIDHHSASPPNAASPSALVLYALTLATFFAASSAPTPLYRLYQASWGFSSGALTFVFASYALSLLLALLTTGALSDYLGRRPVIVGALLLEAIAMLGFVGAHGVGALIAARLLQGFATGVAASAVSAAILDVDKVRGPLTNSVMPLAGMSAGTLGSSVLVQYAPAPMRLVYIVLAILFIVQAIAVCLQAETASRRPGALASMRFRIAVPPAARGALLLVAPIDVAVWALGGFYLSLGPTLVHVVTGSNDAMTGGWVVFALTGGGIAAVLALRKLATPRLLRFGACALALGLIVTLLGVQMSASGLFFIGTVIAGIGFGTGFQGAMRTVMPLAQAHQRAGLMAAFYVLSYLAFSVPAVLAGIAAHHVGLRVTTNTYCAALIVLVALTLVGSSVVERRRRVRDAATDQCAAVVKVAR